MSSKGMSLKGRMSPGRTAQPSRQSTASRSSAELTDHNQPLKGHPSKGGLLTYLEEYHAGLFFSGMEWTAALIVPAAMTPRVNFTAPGDDNRTEVWRVNTDFSGAEARKGTLRLRSGPGTKYKVLATYR